MTNLKKLEVRALRGATEPLCLTFEKGKKITILYGENASGKSTICDALEFLAKGRVGSLEDRGLGKTEQFWHSTTKKPSDVEIKLETSEGECSGRIVKSKVAVSHAENRPNVAILRHRKVQDLINQQPKYRFDVVRPFLDIDLVEASENNLRTLLDKEKKSRDSAATRIEENRVEVEHFWESAGKPQKDALQWARSESKKDTTAFEAEISQFEKLIRECEIVESEKQRLIQFDEQVKLAKNNLATASDKVVVEQKNVSSNLSDMVGILEAANAYFKNHGTLSECPLCGSKEFADGLPAKVDKQLSAIRSLTSAIRLRNEASKNLDLVNSQVLQQKLAHIKAAESLSILLQKKEAFSALLIPEKVEELVNRFLTESDTDLKGPMVDTILTEMGESIASAKSSLQKAREKKGFIDTLKRAIDNYDSNFTAQKDLDILIPRFEKALSTIMKARQQFVDDILRKIAKRVGELYEVIHPSEGLSKIELQLDPDRRASLEILGAFPGTSDVPPGAYFSDSHLDSLGLCIWLAITELQATEGTILVLDDIVGSVDEPHVERLIGLLYDVAQNYLHCIFTTHYRPWREKYRWGWLRNNQIHFVELLPWTHAQGIRYGKTIPPVEELRKLMGEKSPSAQLICASAGVLLEAILAFITQLYECAVPIRKGKPTLGDLLPSISAKLRKALKIEVQVNQSGNANSFKEYGLGSILDDLQNTAQARNIFGAHFNELANYLPEADALGFGKRVLELADLVIDPDCGWPGTDKSGSYWANTADTRRLHPLKQPS